MIEEALLHARQLEEARRSAGFDQAALDSAAQRGFSNGAFEENDEDSSDLIEEFFPLPKEQTLRVESVVTQPASSISSLAEKLEFKAIKHDQNASR